MHAGYYILIYNSCLYLTCIQTKNRMVRNKSFHLLFYEKDQINLKGIFKRLVAGSICFLTVYYMLQYTGCFLQNDH